MITKIFSKTNFTFFSIIAIFTNLSLIYYWYNHQNDSGFNSLLVNILGNSGLVALALYMVRKISLTDNINAKNNLSMLFFSVFLLFIPDVFANTHLLIAHIFVLLGINRLIDLHTLNLSKEKIFDASIFFAIACIFEFWTVLFFLLIFISLLIYILNNIRFWIIPLVGALAVGIILSLYVFAFDTNIVNHILDRLLLHRNFQKLSQAFTSFNTVFLIATTTLLVLFNTGTLKKHLQSTQISIKILLSSIFISLAIFTITQSQDNLIFLVAPISLFMSNFINSIEKNWIKETITYLFVGFSIIYFFLQ